MIVCINIIYIINSFPVNVKHRKTIFVHSKYFRRIVQISFPAYIQNTLNPQRMTCPDGKNIADHAGKVTFGQKTSPPEGAYAA